MACMQLEKICIFFAFINMGVKFILMIVAVGAGNSMIISLVFLGPATNDRWEDYYGYDEEMIHYMRAVLIVDCSLSIFYSVILIVGVRRTSVRLLKSCLFYGTVILFLSTAASVPRFFLMFFDGDYEYLGRRVEAFVLTIICGIQVLVVYKTYKKFEESEDLQRLLRKRSEQWKTEDTYIIGQSSV